LGGGRSRGPQVWSSVCAGWGRGRRALPDARLGFSSMAAGSEEQGSDSGRGGSLPSSCLVWHHPLLPHNNSICPRDALCAWRVPVAQCTRAKDGPFPWDQHFHARLCTHRHGLRSAHIVVPEFRAGFIRSASETCRHVAAASVLSRQSWGETRNALGLHIILTRTASRGARTHRYIGELERALGRAHTFAAATFLVLGMRVWGTVN